MMLLKVLHLPLLYSPIHTYYFFFFFFKESGAPRDLPFSPTRRSSDLVAESRMDVGEARSWAMPAPKLTADKPFCTLVTNTGWETADGCVAWLALALESVQFESDAPRSEEHTSELQSRLHLVCRLLLEK